MEREKREEIKEKGEAMTRPKKVGGVKKSVVDIRPEDEIRAKLRTRIEQIGREIMAAAQPDTEPFDDEPPDDFPRI